MVLDLPEHPNYAPRWAQRAGWWISLGLNPALLLTYLTLYLLFGKMSPLARYPEASKWLLAGVVFFNTFLVPVAITWLLRRNLSLENRRERTQPILFAAFLYGVTWYFMREAALPFFYIRFFLGMTLGLAVSALINLRYRISFHALGAGFMMGLFAALDIIEPVDYMPEVVVSVLLAGMILSARWALLAHSPDQLIAGLLLGFALSFGLMVA